MSGVEAPMGLRVRALLTGWAVAYQGPCEHPDRLQLARPTEFRSRCLDCVLDEGDVPTAGPCDGCGGWAEADGFWCPNPAETGGVLVPIRLCNRCTTANNSEEENMTTETYLPAQVPCALCRSTARGEFAKANMHDACMRAVERNAIVAGGNMNAVVRLLRIARARARFGVR